MKDNVTENSPESPESEASESNSTEFAAEPAAQNVVELSGRRSKMLAKNKIETGLEFFSNGEVHKAIECFEESVRAEETPEGYTYWAWMLSFKGELDEAINLCKIAIAMDPEFGNPYNDIGTYHMKKGELRDAIPWLEKAKECKRYEPRQYPYLNLGRIYLSQGMFLKALREFEGALQYDPENDELRTVVARIRKNHS